MTTIQSLPNVSGGTPLPGARGLLDRHSRSDAEGRARFQNLNFALMRSVKALAIFAEHGEEPGECEDGLTWTPVCAMTYQEHCDACHQAWQACYADPELRPLFDQWKLKPSEGNTNA